MHTPTRPRANWSPPAFIDPALAGTVTIDPTGPFVAGDLARLTLTYAAGRFGIDDTGALRVCFRFATDGGPPQFDDPAGINYVSVEASNAAVLDLRYDYKLNTRPWDRTIVVRVVRGHLREGDTITLGFGDGRGGCPGYRLQTFADPFHQFLVLVDPIAAGSFVPVADQPTFAVVAGPPTVVQALLPTLRRVGESFDLGLRFDDRWGNPSAPGERHLRLAADGPLSGLPAAVAMGAGETSLRIRGLSLHGPGPARVSVLDEDGTLLARSNPVTAASRDGLVSCWADLHAQSGETIGSASVRDYLAFARDQAFLDAVGHQGNDFQITPAFWDELNADMRLFHVPGRFVTVPGYEWSGNTALGGDRNVFFREEGRPIRRSSHALVPDLADEASDCHDARALFAALARDGEDVVCWAHCGGRYADIGYAHDVAIERAVEIHSSWGTFEWLLRDAFALGFRVGVVASSDGHKGRPGSESPGASQFGALGGLTCFLVPEVTRDALFHAMRARHHYGTTGCRLHLAVEAALPPGSLVFTDDPGLPGSQGRPGRSAVMGDIVRGPTAEVVLSIDIAAESPILEIEIRNGADVVETIRPSTTSPGRRRFLATWSGAEYRGRFRQTNWDGSLTVEGNAVASFAPVNFFNPDKLPERIDAHTVAWRSTTTGNGAGLDFTLAEPDVGRIRIDTPHGAIERAVDDVGSEPATLDCGKLDRRLSLARLPDVNLHRTFGLTRTVSLKREGDSPLYVAVTLEDGHRAWSSPIYVLERR